MHPAAFVAISNALIRQHDEPIAYALSSNFCGSSLRFAIVGSVDERSFCAKKKHFLKQNHHKWSKKEHPNPWQRIWTVDKLQKKNTDEQLWFWHAEAYRQNNMCDCPSATSPHLFELIVTDCRTIPIPWTWLDWYCHGLPSMLRKKRRKLVPLHLKQQKWGFFACRAGSNWQN